MSSVLLYHPLGLGDHVACSGIVREYAKTHDRIGLFCSPQNEVSVSYLYRDLRNCTLHVIPSHKDAARFRFLNRLRLSRPHYDRVQAVGSFDPESGIQYERQFYNSAGVDFQKLWDSFYLMRDPKKEEKLFKLLVPSQPYIFVHDDARFPLKSSNIDATLPHVRPDLSVTQNIFDYCTILEKAQEIHVMDSSFMFLVDCLPYINLTQRLVVHRYARENLAWNLPILKKNWEIHL